MAAENFSARAKEATKLYEAIEATGHPRNRVRSVAMKRMKTASRYQGRAPIKHGLVGNGFCLAYGGF